jgi:hypothetical protein
MIDRYTKAVLTVIAGCLLWICAMGAGVPLTAQRPSVQAMPNAAVQPVVIVGTGTLDQRGTVTVNFTPQGRTDPTVPVQLPYSAAKPLPVSLPYTAASPMPAMLGYSANSPLAIEITAVKKVGEWEPVRVRVEDAPTKSRPGLQQ